ncbi:MAG: hypothetical protein HZA89_14095 [Verrucomicrobia bacterium]|nr:hypothetical protein [Verrucomicrobiota bacterium]
MKQSIVRIAAAVYVIGFIASTMTLCIPPACLPLFIGLGVIALIPLAFGSRGYRIFGACALALAVVAAVEEYRAGKEWEERFRSLREKLRTGGQTNNPSATAKPGK